MGLITGYNRIKSFTREDVLAVPTPEPTDTWKPVSHGTIIELVERQAHVNGFDIVSEQYGMSADGHKLFFYFEFDGGKDGYRRSIGGRNSHNQSLALKIAAGSNVLVCSNMMLSGDWLASRKHTSGIDPEQMVTEAYGNLTKRYDALDGIIERLKKSVADRATVNDLVIRAARTKAILNGEILTALDEIWEPRHEEFRPVSKDETTLWNVYNGFTQLFHGVRSTESERQPLSLTNAMRRADRLAELFNFNPATSLAEEVEEVEETENQLELALV